jgi:hypothetical protein
MKRVERIWIRIDKKFGGGSGFGSMRNQFSPPGFSVVSAGECGCAKRVRRDGRADDLDRSGRRDRAAREAGARGSVTVAAEGVPGNHRVVLVRGPETIPRTRTSDAGGRPTQARPTRSPRCVSVTSFRGGKHSSSSTAREFLSFFSFISYFFSFCLSMVVYSSFIFVIFFIFFSYILFYLCNFLL